MQMQHGAAVRQREFIDGRKVPGEGFAERGFRDVSVDGFAAANEFVKLRVSWGNPLKDEVGGRETAAQFGDTVHRDLAAEQQMVQDGEHHNRIEVASATAEEGGVFTVLPPGRGGRMGQVDAEGKDIFPAAPKAGGEAVNRLQVGVDRDDFSSSVGSQPGVDARVAADVEKISGFCVGQGGGNETSLAGVILVAVVGRGLGVV